VCALCGRLILTCDGEREFQDSTRAHCTYLYTESGNHKSARAPSSSETPIYGGDGQLTPPDCAMPLHPSTPCYTGILDSTDPPPPASPPTKYPPIYGASASTPSIVQKSFRSAPGYYETGQIRSTWVPDAKQSDRSVRIANPERISEADSG
jgi:hypothetical protein